MGRGVSSEGHRVRRRVAACVVSALPPALRTARWLLLLTLPLSLAVLALKVTGALALLAALFRPLFGLIGLPGEAAIVYATACLLNIYSCIAVIETLGLAGRTVTILALMCLIAHNLPVEVAVQKQAGSSAGRMLLLRLGTIFLAGFTLLAGGHPAVCRPGGAGGLDHAAPPVAGRGGGVGTPSAPARAATGM